MLFEPMGWKESAVTAGLELIKSEHIDVIFSSFGPTVDHIIGERLHKLTNIPWVAEFRDPWAYNTTQSLLLFR